MKKPSSALWNHIETQLSCNLENDFSIKEKQLVSGGNINESYQVNGHQPKQIFFIKINNNQCPDLLLRESESLLTIKQSNTINVPNVIIQGHFEDWIFLVLEYIDLNTAGNEYELGKQLVNLHSSHHKHYGFYTDNFIGTTVQQNTWSTSWLRFWLDCRLNPQLQLAYKNGYQKKLQCFESALHQATHQLLQHHQPQASLVHGDLWSGNKGFLSDGTPIIFDPACYYGDREVDIAMTELFGGFNNHFYLAYNNTWSLDNSYEKRKSLYNLYHQLNHLNLFGSSYLHTCIQTIKSIINTS